MNNENNSLTSHKLGYCPLITFWIIVIIHLILLILPFYYLSLYLLIIAPFTISFILKLILAIILTRNFYKNSYILFYESFIISILNNVITTGFLIFTLFFVSQPIKKLNSNFWFFLIFLILIII